jgi:CrcB protein
MTNMLALAIGVVWLLADERKLLNPQARVVILRGFMGAFITFSLSLLRRVSSFCQSNGRWLFSTSCHSLSWVWSPSSQG